MHFLFHILCNVVYPTLIYRHLLITKIHDNQTPPEIKTNKELFLYSKNQLTPTHGRVTFVFNYHDDEQKIDYITNKMHLLQHNTKLPIVTSAENLSDTFYGLEAIVKLQFKSDGTVKSYCKYADIIGDQWTLDK